MNAEQDYAREQRRRAAADAMYDALQTLLTACVDDGWPTKAEHATPLAVARDALRIADGREP